MTLEVQTAEITRQRIKLISEQTRKLRLKNDFLTRKLLNSDDVAAAWGKSLARFRSRVLELPNKLTPLLTASASYGEAEEIVRAGCYELLSELAGFDVSAFNTGLESLEEHEDEVDAQPEEKKRRKRRA